MYLSKETNARQRDGFCLSEETDVRERDCFYLSEETDVRERDGLTYQKTPMLEKGIVLFHQKKLYSTVHEWTGLD